jgi:hypothetical protein
MRVESDFLHDYKKESRNLNFELIAVTVFKSSVSLAAYSLLYRKTVFFNVNKSKRQKHDNSKNEVILT